LETLVGKYSVAEGFIQQRNIVDTVVVDKYSVTEGIIQQRNIVDSCS
jgi:hypothetical protein